MTRSRWIKSLGKEDQLVEYFKPQAKALWMTREQHDALPDSIIVRELRRTVVRPGLGHVTLTMATTLLDPQTYPADELLELRLRRWDVATNPSQAQGKLCVISRRPWAWTCCAARANRACAKSWRFSAWCTTSCAW